MAVKLRLTRRGSTHRPFYRIVAIDSRNKRDGDFCEDLGMYDPLGDTKLTIDAEKAIKWLRCGAQPSSVVRDLLRRAGIKANAPTVAG